MKTPMAIQNTRSKNLNTDTSPSRDERLTFNTLYNLAKNLHSKWVFFHLGTYVCINEPGCEMLSEY